MRRLNVCVCNHIPPDWICNLAHLPRKTTEARPQYASEWIGRHVKAERRYRPPRGGKIRKDFLKEGKGVASRFFQLSGHAAIGIYLVERTKTIQSDKCWWCGSGERPPREDGNSDTPGGGVGGAGDLVARGGGGTGKEWRT